VAERITDLLAMGCIVAISFVLEFEFIYQFFTERFSVYKIVLIIVGLLAFAVLFFVFVKRSKHKIALKIKAFVNGLIEGVSSILRMRQKKAFLLHTLFIWLMYVLMFYVTTFALDETSTIPFAAVLLGFISASFSIAATNGGIGSYPVAVYLAFSMFSIAKEPSIAFGWIVWASQTLMIIVFGGLSLIYLPIYNRKKKLL